MSRDSRLWQNALAHARIFEGDVAECNRWYAFAQQKLRFMLANHPGATSQIFTPAEGIAIRVDTRPNRITISTKSGSIYMESGFIDLISAGKCTEAAYRPGTLNYNAKVTALLGSSDTPVQGKVKLKDNDTTESPFSGEVIADGAQSLAVGCKESAMLPTVVTPFPCTNTYSNGGYCGLGLQQRKDCMLKVPASMYTGKLRLFVQAMYGSTREDFSYSGARSITLTDQSGQTYQNPKDGVITLGNQGINQSYWLYTIGNGGYALCYMQYPNIVMIPLLLPDIALKFAEAFATHPNNTDFSFKTKIEAYLLAYAVPVYDSSLWIRVPISGPMPSGDPLYYGWHTNWAGDEAHIVTFYKDEAANRFLSNQYKLTLTQTITSNTMTFVAAIEVVEANKPWVNWGTAQPLHIFYYDELTQQMIALAKPAGTHPSPFTHDAPVYCVTKLNIIKGDCELVTLRAYRQTQTLSNTFHADYSKLIDADRWAEERTFRTGVGGDSGFKATGAVIGSWVGGNEIVNSSFKVNYYFIGEVSGAFVQIGGWDNNNNWISNLGYEFVQANIYRNDSLPEPMARAYTDGLRFTRVSETINSANRTTSAFLEIPLGACDAFTVGVSTQNVSGGESRSEETGLYVWDDFLTKADNSWNPTGPVINSFSGTGGSLYVRGWTAYTSNFHRLESSTGTVTTPPGTYYQTRVYDCVGGEAITQAIASSAPGDSRYFAPTLSNPGTGTIDYARASIQSGSISEHTLYTKDYGFIKNTSVGWA